ncbi:hypothetical protein NVSP9465_02321 [Novosphingobium sp. CECT 9465]|nr:hypothetical protein NVSP9465_02321 [Novosphingobium sp. CECT 9465]
MRVLKKTVLKRLLMPTQGGAHYAGKQPNASVQQHQRRTFPARKHDIADGDFLDIAAFEDALVKPFKPATQQDHPRPRRQLPHALLRQRLAARGKRNDGPLP